MKKKGNKKMPTPRHKLIHNPIPTSLFLSRPQCISYSQFNVKMFFICLMHSQQTNKIQNRDVGIGGGAPEGAGPLTGATPRRGVWRRSRPLLLAGTSATKASDFAVFLNGVLSLFVGKTEWSCQEESDDQLRERPNSLSTHSPAGPQGLPLPLFLQLISVHM